MESIKSKKRFTFVALRIIAACLLGGINTAAAQTGSDVPVQVAQPSLVAVLPDTLARQKATAAVSQYSVETLEALVGSDKAPIYQEYKVVSAASRLYGPLRVDLFQCQTRAGAFGLFSYFAGQGVALRSPGSHPLDTGGNAGPSQVVTWTGNLFVQVGPASGTSPVSRTALSQIAQAVSALAGSAALPKPPTLLDSLPPAPGTAQTARYFLGPRSLNDYLPQASDMFGFAGGAEAVLAPYKQQSKGDSPLNLLIVEYNTPQFAREALDHANGVLSSLPQDEQARIVLKRVGNYLVEASNATDREQAEHLVDSVKYPYTVKWFQVPFHRREDPHAGQKAAQIILSSFGIVALTLAGALTGGGIVGTVIFLRRRRQQREVFSDAGGMLRLDIEELCTGALHSHSQSLPAGENLG